MERDSRSVDGSGSVTESTATQERAKTVASVDVVRSTVLAKPGVGRELSKRCDPTVGFLSQLSHAYWIYALDAHGLVIVAHLLPGRLGGRTRCHVPTLGL